MTLTPCSANMSEIETRVCRSPSRQLLSQTMIPAEPVVRWRGHANLLYANWLNYHVYQLTPYDIGQIPEGDTFSSF